MAYRFQHRRDTEANWRGVILADGEIGIIQRNGRNTNLYKIGDGVTTFENLPLFGFDGTLSGDLNTGDDNSRQAVSKEVLVKKFNDIDDELSKSASQSSLDSLSESFDEYKEATDKSIEDINSSIENINNTLEDVNGAIEDINDSLTTHGETFESIKNDITELQNKHVALPKSEFDSIYPEIDGVREGLEDGVFYYVYEEIE